MFILFRSFNLKVPASLEDFIAAAETMTTTAAAADDVDDDDTVVWCGVVSILTFHI